eukprot:CFRG3681T1
MSSLRYILSLSTTILPCLTAHSSAKSSISGTFLHNSSSPNDVYRVQSRGTRKPLRFNSDGQFKVVQFADLHFGENAWDDWGPEQDRKSILVMREVLQIENPNLVVFSGDQITDNNIIANQTLYWNMAVSACEELNVPWAVIFGNHDETRIDPELEELFHDRKLNTTTHKNSTRGTLLALDKSHALSYTNITVDHEKETHGDVLSTYWLDVWQPLTVSEEQTDTKTRIRRNTKIDEDAEGEAKLGLRLWFMDSGGGNLPLRVHQDQIEWLKRTAEELQVRHEVNRAIDRMENGDKTDDRAMSNDLPHIPGILFVHAPPPDVKLCHCSHTSLSLIPAAGANALANAKLNSIDDNTSTYSTVQSPTCVGMSNEDVSSFLLDHSGNSKSTVTSFGVEAAHAGIKLVAFGHNHGNDYCCSVPQYKVHGNVTYDKRKHTRHSLSSPLSMCYGRHSGYGGYGEDDWKKGARVYMFDLNKEDVVTHVRLQGGAVVNQWLVRGFFDLRLQKKEESKAAASGIFSHSSDGYLSRTVLTLLARTGMNQNYNYKRTGIKLQFPVLICLLA